MLTFSALWFVLAGSVAYIIFRTIYRLYYHPLSGVPGPNLAAATHLYEFYYNFILQGKYLWRIEKMHMRYGPIIRINPREVHISDPKFCDEIYASSTRKRDKDIHFIPTYIVPESMVGTPGHEHHRFRRGILNEYFSQRAVLGLTDIVNERIRKLIQRFQEAQSQQTVICLDDAFAALTSDLITSYCFGKHWEFLEDKDFRNCIRRAVEDGMTWSHFNCFFPWISKWFSKVSPSTLVIIMPGKGVLFDFIGSILEYATKELKEKPHLVADKASQAYHKSMIAALTDRSIPPEERTPSRLRDEVYTVMGAGGETTARTLTMASFYIASDKTIRDKLRSELKQVLPTPTSTTTLAELFKLPYLNGVVNESLRLSYGIIGRLPRVAPSEVLKYHGHVLPPGTPMSSSAYLIHRDSNIFPHPEVFDPERWIKAANNGEHLERYLLTFSRGSRGCIGINLARMELFFTLAHFNRWFDIELYDTTVEDVRFIRDLIVGYTRRGPLRVYAKLSTV